MKLSVTLLVYSLVIGCLLVLSEQLLELEEMVKKIESKTGKKLTRFKETSSLAEENLSFLVKSSLRGKSGASCPGAGSWPQIIIMSKAWHTLLQFNTIESQNPYLGVVTQGPISYTFYPENVLQIIGPLFVPGGLDCVYAFKYNGYYITTEYPDSSGTSRLTLKTQNLGP